MNASQNLLPFPLFHGTSSHYLSAFQPGYTPTLWPHKDVALRLLTDAWDELSLIRHEIPADVGKDLFGDVTHEEIPWMVKNVIEQAGGYSNWQHGELYLTPSKRSAVRYAFRGARYGGELLTFCKTTIDALARIDDRKRRSLRAREALGLSVTSLHRDVEARSVLYLSESVDSFDRGRVLLATTRVASVLLATLTAWLWVGNGIVNCLSRLSEGLSEAPPSEAPTPTTYSRWPTSSPTPSSNNRSLRPGSSAWASNVRSASSTAMYRGGTPKASSGDAVDVNCPTPEEATISRPCCRATTMGNALTPKELNAFTRDKRLA